MNYRHFCNIFFVSFTLMSACSANASVVIENTRIIYPSQSKEITVHLSNHSKKPILVQTWLDDGDPNADPSTTSSPFVITPPIFRLEGERKQSLRIMLIAKTSLPADRESQFWLNVLDVPGKQPGAENVIRVALRSRLKLFYRPSGLPGSPAQAARELIWHHSGDRITVENTSPWYVSLVSIATVGNTFTADAIPPKSNRTFSGKINRGAPFRYLWIDDNGAPQEQTAVMQ